MLQSILKWLAALGVGALTAAGVAASQYLSVHAGTEPITGVDPFVAGIVVSLFTKLVTWLTSKLPAGN